LKLRVLLQTGASRRDGAAVAVAALGQGHRHGLIDALPVGRGEVQQHRLVAGQVAHLGRNLDLVAVKHDRVARLDVVDLHPRRGRDVGPGPKHPGGRNQRALRRQHQVQRPDGHDHGQGITEADYRSAVDGRFQRDLRQVGGSPLLHGPINDRRNAAPGRPQQQEVHQAVLQQRLASLDRMRGEYGVDLANQRR
jgi:hypothetical protein